MNKQAWCIKGPSGVMVETLAESETAAWQNFCGSATNWARHDNEAKGYRVVQVTVSEQNAAGLDYGTPEGRLLADIAPADALAESRAELARLNTAKWRVAAEARERELRAECERLRQQCQEEIRLRSEAATRAIAAEAECERLRRDSERYRTTRRLSSRAMLPDAWKEGYTEGELDISIDVASAEGER